MFKIHREGTTFVLFSLVLAVIVATLVYLFPGNIFLTLFLILVVGLLLFMTHFFRNPSRPVDFDDPSLILSPADGKVVAIEEHFEEEYLMEKRIQLSIFMSPLNVHYNTIPVSGKILYKRHHPGKYLVAWHPKSSTENERTTVVIENKQVRLLLRQIAGAMARRIVNYAEVGDEAIQGKEMGFIKFGSRVDLMLPLDAKIQVSIGQMVKANVDTIANLSSENT